MWTMIDMGSNLMQTMKGMDSKSHLCVPEVIEHKVHENALLDQNL
jgi:hypothetical protein